MLPYQCFKGDKPSTFLAFYVPIILSMHIDLGSSFEPVNFIMPLTLWGISEAQLLLFPIDYTFCVIYISIYSNSRPVHSELRQYVLLHTFLPCLSLRPPIYRLHPLPLRNFRLALILEPLRQLSTDFNGLMTILCLSTSSPSVVLW